MRLRHSGYAAAVTALALSACGGNGGSSPPQPQPSSTAALVLVPGTVAQYSGTDTTAHVYASPTAGQANYTGAYTFKLTRTVETAAAGAPATLDVHDVTTYTTTQDPGTGTSETSLANDTYDNQVAATGGTTVEEVAANAVAVGTDESAGALGGGPFTRTTNTVTTYNSPFVVGTFPLVAGATITEPIARSVTISATDANAGTTDTATTFVASSKNTVNTDGSYSLAEQLSNGEAQTNVEQSNGSGTIDATGPVYTLADTIGAPTNAGTGYTIPVTVDKQFATTGATPAPIATTVAYAAADWYPGAALPVVPFQTDTLTVKGAATSLPSACTGTITEPNVYEIDTNASTLNIVEASASATTQQNFNSNGTPVCILRTVTTKNYALTTGLLNETTTETYAQVLTSLTLPTSASSKLRKT